MWKWDNTKYNCINFGIQEPNMVNVAAGLASQGKKVIIYGVCGFVMYKAYEQIKMNIRGWADTKGSIIFVNAGAGGQYALQGKGHFLNDDREIMTLLNIYTYDPPDRSTFIKQVKEGLRKETGVRHIRLGWDGEVWKKQS
jgi:transketolase